VVTPPQLPPHPQPAGTSLMIRTMRPDDDIDAELDLRHRAFGPMAEADRAYWRGEVLGCIEDGRQFGVWDGAGLVGAARYYDMRQFWHGRALPMAGIGGVKVAPEARGRGVGRAMMTHVLRELAGRGYPLSVLYPATAPLYRSMGWELAGGCYRADVPARSLAALLPPDPHADGPASGAGRPRVRRAGPDDAKEVIEVLATVHAAARDSGPATMDTASVRRWLAGAGLFAYLAADGFLAYGWHGPTDKAIRVELLQAGSAATARELWGIVASHASVTEVIHATVGPADPVAWLTREPDVSVRNEHAWMLRVLDPVAAIAGRGFGPGTSAGVTLRLADPGLPENAGEYTLSVRDGTGSLRRAGTTVQAGSVLSAGPRGFAALYAGVPLATLRVAGLVSGGDEDTDAALDAAFAANPYLLYHF
jgi:predicted acetyltransferase